MAKESESTVYPRIPSKNWWDLRKKAVQSPPKQVTLSYLQTVLGIGEGAAKNLLPGLRTVGLVDSKNGSMPLMNDWRDDEHYADVCKKIMEKVYPDELRSTFQGPKPDRNQVKRWFALKTKTGDAASNQMAAFYLLLCEADPKKSDGEVPTVTKATTRKLEATSKKKLRQTVIQSSAPTDQHLLAGKGSDTSVSGRASGNDEIPSLHIDVQIHISADASAEQIDQVFASMAKHIYRKE